MVFFNWATMQMAAKVVYYGPGLCGKTTNLSYIYAKTAPGSRGEMVSLETESDRTLFFDLLPIEVGTIGGFKTRLQLYTVPGQVFYNTTRKLVLKGVDGVVFVADSQRPMREANIESFENLRVNLAELGLDLDETPLVLQYNKRDLKNILTIDELNADLNPENKFPWFEASAINGEGVFETLKEITKATLKKLRKKMASPREGTAGRPLAPRAPASRPAATVSAAALAQAAEEGVEEAAVPSGPMPRPVPAPQPAAAATSPESAPADAEAVPAPPGVEPAGEAFAQPDGASGKASQSEEPSSSGPFDDQSSEVSSSEEPFGEANTETSTGGGAPEATAPPEGTAPPADNSAPAPTDAAGEAPPEPDEVEPAQKEPETEVDVVVDFDRSTDEPEKVTPPPVKTVHVSNQLDILAELDSLRERATMAAPTPRKGPKQPELDIDSLLSGGGPKTREIRRKVSHGVNSDIFKRTSSLQVAVRLVDRHGDTVHTLDPISLPVKDISSVDILSLLLTLDLENQK